VTVIRREDDELYAPSAAFEVVGALQSPALESELRGFQQHVRELPRPTVRHLGRRTLTLSALTTTTLLFSGAMTAAAYTANLPEPVQRAAHRVLGPLGVPRPQPHPPTRLTPMRTVPVATEPPDVPQKGATATKKGTLGKAHATRAHPRKVTPKATPRPSVSPSPRPSGSPAPGPLPTPSALPPH
jgi:hypothetical protein